MFSKTMIIGASATNFANYKTSNSGTLLDTDPISSSYIPAFGNLMTEKQNKENIKSPIDKYNDFIGKINNKNMLQRELKKP